MKAKFITNDDKEIRRLAKCKDMAIMLWNLKYSFKEFFTDSDGEVKEKVTTDEVFEAIDILLERNSIDIDDLID